MGPQGASYFFCDQLCSKNARKLRFHALFHFNTRKYMVMLIMNLFQLTLGCCELPIGTKFKISIEFGPLQVK